MTAPKSPTPLEDLEDTMRQYARMIGRMPDERYDRIRTFLSSPVAQAIQDPGMRAALEVIVGAFPGMLSLFEDRSEAASITFASLVENTLKTAFTEYHRALKAKEMK